MESSRNNESIIIDKRVMDESISGKDLEFQERVLEKLLEKEIENNEDFSDFFNNLDSMSMTQEDLNVEVEYLIDLFLVKQTLTMFFAKAGQGKSFLMLALAMHLLGNGSIKKCYYFDMDNSKASLKARNLDKVLAETPELKYIHNTSIEVSPKDILDSLDKQTIENPESMIYLDYLFIFDSIRDFLGGKDMNSDKDVIPLMKQLKNLRDAGATVIFLHHTSKDGEGTQFKGSSSFNDSVDVSYALSSKRVGNENKLSYTLEVAKDRISVEESAFDLDTSTMTLTSKKYDMATLSKNETSFIEKAQEIVANHSEGINQSQLLESLGKTAQDTTGRKYLKKFSGKYWDSQKVASKNNALFYFPINDETEELLSA